MDLSPQDHDALEALMVFYRDAGVSDVIGEEPVNAFAQKAAARPAASAREAMRQPASAQPLAAPVRIGNAAISAGDSAADARELAAGAQTLEALKDIMTAFDGCALKATASRLVFEDGVRGSALMLVGEAPGRDEDIEGKPFVGRSGQLLDRILAAAGFDRSKVYIANIVPWRPPGNRTPTPQETATCLPFIERQIELSAPRILLCLGSPSAQALMGIDGIMKGRGRWQTRQFGAHKVDAIATLHPAYLLRNPIGKRAVWADMLEVKLKLATSA